MDKLRVTLCGIELDNPVIPASGTFGFGYEFAELYDINLLGTFSFKGTTLSPRFANPTPRIAECTQGMINAVEAGALNIEKLEAMTCVCSVGLDMIAIPGDTTASTISGIIADEAALGMVNQKTTAVRVIPAYGKKVGDHVDFGGLLGHAPVMSVNTFDCSAFVNRKGRIPAPIHSFKN